MMPMMHKHALMRSDVLANEKGERNSSRVASTYLTYACACGFYLPYACACGFTSLCFVPTAEVILINLGHMENKFK